MILSAAIDNGYIFLSLIAILTSVVSAVYYLAIIRQIFFDKSDYILNTEFYYYITKLKKLGSINNINYSLNDYSLNDYSLSDSIYPDKNSNDLEYHTINVTHVQLDRENDFNYEKLDLKNEIYTTLNDTTSKDTNIDNDKNKFDLTLNNTNAVGIIYDSSLIRKNKVIFFIKNIVLSSSLSNIISILTLFITLFMLIPRESLSMANILALILFNP